MAKEQKVIDTRVELDAPVEAVWRALTDAEELTRWFPLEARVSPGKGGRIWMSWGKPHEFESRIDEWLPNQRLRLVADLGDATVPGGPIQVAVDHFLEAGTGGGTVLRLVHSGFGPGDQWDHEFDATRRGWEFELRGLKLYLERFRGTPRETVHESVSFEGPFESFWNFFTGPNGLAPDPEISRLKRGDQVVLSGLDEAFAGEAWMVSPPKDLAVILEGNLKGYLRIRIDENCSGPGREANLWISTYGWSAKDRESVAARFGIIMKAAIAESSDISLHA